MTDRPADDDYIAAARAKLPAGCAIEIDGEAAVSNHAAGAYVQAWMWVYDREVESEG